MEKDDYHFPYQKLYGSLMYVYFYFCAHMQVLYQLNDTFESFKHVKGLGFKPLNTTNEALKEKWIQRFAKKTTYCRKISTSSENVKVEKKKNFPLMEQECEILSQEFNDFKLNSGWLAVLPSNLCRNLPSKT